MLKFVGGLNLYLYLFPKFLIDLNLPSHNLVVRNRFEFWESSEGWVRDLKFCFLPFGTNLRVCFLLEFDGVDVVRAEKSWCMYCDYMFGNGFVGCLLGERTVAVVEHCLLGHCQ